MSINHEKGSKIKTLKSKEMSVDYPVLWWTGLPSDSTTNQEYSPVLGDCGFEYTCTFSDNRELLDKTKVVLFDRARVNPNDLPGSGRDSPQAWVLNDVHDPEMALGGVSTTDLKKIPFTHLWSYKFESDFVETNFQPSPSSFSETPEEETRIFESGGFLDMVMSPPMIDLVEKNRLCGLRKNQGGKAAIVWIVEGGHATEEQDLMGVCKDSPSGRESYVKELLKLVDIDIYGSSCLANTPWPIHEDTQTPLMPQEIMKDYKFVLALERINCKDHVTSSLADALVVGAIPIVDGPKDYTRFSPTKDALIQISLFIAPELLVQEIDSLDRNDTKYLARLDYKKHYNLDAGTTILKELLPDFKNTFGNYLGYPTSNSDPGLKTNDDKIFGPDRHGARCKICQLAHDLSEGSFNWEPTKKDFKLFDKEQECESIPRYLSGLPTQMEAYDHYLQNIGSSRNNSLGVEVTFDGGNVSVSVGPDPKSPAVNPDPNLSTWNQSEGSEGSLSSSTATSLHKTPPYELYYLLMLFGILIFGLGILAIVTTKNTRKFIIWPWRRVLYNRIPDDDQDAQSLEQVMLREMGQDLIYQ